MCGILDSPSSTAGGRGCIISICRWYAAAFSSSVGSELRGVNMAHRSKLAKVLTSLPIRHSWWWSTEGIEYRIIIITPFWVSQFPVLEVQSVPRIVTPTSFSITGHYCSFGEDNLATLRMSLNIYQSKQSQTSLPSSREIQAIAYIPSSPW